MKRLYVCNLPFDLSDAMLRNYFEEFGDVRSAVHVKDKATGRERGFGFVEMEDDAAELAIKNLDQRPLGGASGRTRVVRVQEAREREERPRQGRTHWQDRD